jgi:hypothetical protein
MSISSSNQYSHCIAVTLTDLSSKKQNEERAQLLRQNSFQCTKMENRKWKMLNKSHVKNAFSFYSDQKGIIHIQITKLMFPPICLMKIIQENVVNISEEVAGVNKNIKTRK